ncbi:hypothetical protein Psuf_017700 [Phytohabitans suffuscus]|uniref:Uncharacterized protein n=1 Tax=Phytohabitans suffuscus TaxID=624315 RepID=A0A6F8YEG3_9ACTN|nr:hypothetical protein Psuf_017700 [Phytohabitans suffuscus]
MPRRTRSDGERRRDDFERRTRDEEYRTLARELHREWCERLDDDGELMEDGDLGLLEDDDR